MGATARWDDENPWTQRQVRTLAVLVALGLVGLGLCWYTLSGEAAYQDQVPWLIGAIVCVALVGVGMAYWLLLGVRAVHAGSLEVSHIVRAHTHAHAYARDPRRGSATAAASAPPHVGFVATAAMTRVHREGCLMVRGKNVSALSAAEASARGLTLCGACNR